nr:MAG TPA: hypothetical protein [Caudoviricetes sp.]
MLCTPFFSCIINSVVNQHYTPRYGPQGDEETFQCLRAAALNSLVGCACRWLLCLSLYVLRALCPGMLGGCVVGIIFFSLLPLTLCLSALGT